MKAAILASLMPWVAASGTLRWQVQEGTKLLDHRCVETKGSETLLDWMTREKVELEASVDGSVCKIQGVGCPSSHCFCECGLLGCRYWALFTRKKGEPWKYAKVGANALRSSEYESVAWVWTEGNMRKTSSRPLELKDSCRAP